MAVNVNQKGGRLDGGALSEEVLASSDSITDRGQSGHAKGLQQHFTPKPVAEFVAKVMNAERHPVLDLTAGDGSLLSGFDKAFRFGVEIDHDQVKAGDYYAVKGDVQHVFPILRAMDLQLPMVVLNPPFGLDWQDPSMNDGNTTSSTKLAFQMGVQLLSRDGHGVLICGKKRFDEEIAPLPEAAGFYFIAETADLWEDVTLDCVVAFFVKQVRRAWGTRTDEKPTAVRMPLPVSQLVPSNATIVGIARTAREAFNRRASVGYIGRLDPAWVKERMDAAQVEYDRRTGKRLKRENQHDVYLSGGKTRVRLTRYAKIILASKEELHFVESLRSLPANWYAQNRRSWRRLVQMDEDGLLKLDPAMIEKIARVMDETEKLLVPMYAIKPQQRLAWVDSEELDELECIKADQERGFEVGKKYRVATFPDTERTEYEKDRPVVNQKTGEADLKTFKVRRKYLKIVVWGDHSRYEFGEEKSDIEYLIAHFNLPDPGTVADKFPAEVAEMEGLLKRLEARQAGRCPYDDKDKGWVKGERSSWAFKPFQLMDLSRLLVKRAGLLAWEQGLGKTLAGTTFIESHFELGEAQKCALIVCPKDLIPNWQDEYELWYGKRPQVILDFNHARSIAKHLKEGGEGIYICHYELLTRRNHPSYYEPFEFGWNGIKVERVVEEKDEETGESFEVVQSKTIPTMGFDIEVEEAWTETVRDPETYQVTDTIEHPRTVERKFKTVETNCPECGMDYGDEYRPRVGMRHAFCSNCGFAGAHRKRPSIGNVLSTAFRHGLLVLDETTWIKGNQAERSKAIRGLNAKYILGLTGTPIKNYVRDAFWALWKCLGNDTPRFPYTYDGATAFENDFCVIEWDVKANGHVGQRKVKADVTNLAKLWRLLSSSIIRRRKEETGEHLVDRTFYPVVTPLGVAQHKQTAEWLRGFAEFFKRENPDHPVVLSGAVEFMAPMLGQLPKLEYAATAPEADPDRDYWHVPNISNWTPKNAKTLEIAMHHASKGQKVLIGSCTLAATAWFAEQLNERGVKAETMLVEDEEGPPRSKEAMKRAQIVKKFQAGDAQVLSAGVAAMAYGHNLDKGSVIILNGLPWDYAGLDQFIARCHRLTSKHEVSIYVMLAEGTLDEKKWKLLVEKGDAANLALDGRLIEQQEAPISKEQVIRELAERGLPITGNEVPEQEIEQAWSAITSPADLPEFVRPEPQKVIDAEAEQTDATTFARETLVSFETSHLEGFDQAEREGAHTYQAEEVESDGGELRDGAVSEEAGPLGEAPVEEVETPQPEEAVEAGERASEGMVTDEELDDAPIIDEPSPAADLTDALAERGEEEPEEPMGTFERDVDLDSLVNEAELANLREQAEPEPERELALVGSESGEQGFFDFDF